MTPSRTHGKTGSYEIEETFRNVGEIRQSLRTEDLDEFNNRRALLRKLEKGEKWDLLRAFKARKIKIEQLIEADANERLGSTLADVKLFMNLWDQLENAIPTIRKKAVTLSRYADSLKSLQVKAASLLPGGAKLEDLAKVNWDDLYDGWNASNADWMHMKRAVSKLVGVVLDDKYHPFVRKLRQSIPNKKVKKRTPRITLEDFLTITSDVPSHALRSYWCLVVTGLRDRSEYLRCKPEHLIHKSCTIEVPGTKTDGSEAPIKVSPRLWHLVVAAIPSTLQYRRLHVIWQEACVRHGYAHYEPSTRFKSGFKYVGLTLHDLRHAHGQWAIDQGIDQSKVQASYRHENSQQTADYVRYNASGEVSEAIADLISPALKPKPHGRKRA